MDEKRCSRCKETKPVEAFYRNKATKDGRTSYCKICSREKAASWVANNRERAEAYRKERYWKDPDRFRAAAKASAAANPEKVRARTTAYRLTNPEKVKAATQAWRKLNREHIKKYDEKRRANDPEKILGWSRAWYHKNKERVSKRAKERRLENYDRYTEIARRWKAENKEKDRAITKAWFVANPHKAKLFSSRRRERKLGAGGSTSPEQLRARIDFYGGLCYVCDKPYEAIDHVIPLAKGGTGWPANLRPICTSCNSRKKDKMPALSAGLPLRLKL